MRVAGAAHRVRALQVEHAAPGLHRVLERLEHAREADGEDSWWAVGRIFYGFFEHAKFTKLVVPTSDGFHGSQEMHMIAGTCKDVEAARAMQWTTLSPSLPEGTLSTTLVFPGLSTHRAQLSMTSTGVSRHTPMRHRSD